MVKALEEAGIGRPSTYAPIIRLLMERNYVVKEVCCALVVLWCGSFGLPAVNNCLPPLLASGNKLSLQYNRSDVLTLARPAGPPPKKNANPRARPWSPPPSGASSPHSSRTSSQSTSTPASPAGWRSSWMTCRVRRMAGWMAGWMGGEGVGKGAEWRAKCSSDRRLAHRHRPRIAAERSRAPAVAGPAGRVLGGVQ